MSEFQEVRTTQHQEGQEQRVTTFKITQLIWLLLGLLEAAIGLRVIFKLIAVNGANSFATLLFGVTGIFVAPFASLVGAPSAEGMVLEISSVIAMLIYLVIGWGLVKIVSLILYRPRGAVSTSQTTVAERTVEPTVVDASKVVITRPVDPQRPLQP